MRVNRYRDNSEHSRFLLGKWRTTKYLLWMAVKLICVGILLPTSTLHAQIQQEQEIQQVQEINVLQGASRSWDLTPMIVVAPNQTLFLALTNPLAAYNEQSLADGSVKVRSSLWHAIGGQVVFASDEWLVYRAPSVEGIYLVYWEDAEQTTRFGFFVSVKEVPVCDEILAESEFAGYIGAYIPLTEADHAPTALFLAQRRSVKPERNAPPDYMDNEGRICIDFPPNKPLLPVPQRPCRGRAPVNEQTHTEHSQWREQAGTIEVSAEIAAQLSAIGINVTVGTTINVYAEWRRSARFRTIDCYRCQNGSWVWVGSRVEYETCNYLIAYTPPWICLAVERGVLPGFTCPRKPIYFRHCVSGGSDNCKCPPSYPAITGPNPCSWAGN